MMRSKGKRPLDSIPLTGVIGQSLLPPLPAVKRPCIGSLTSEVAAFDSAISEGPCFCHKVLDFQRKLVDLTEESKGRRFLLQKLFCSLTSEVAAIDSTISEGRCFCQELPDFLRKLVDQMEESKGRRFPLSEESAQPWEKSPCPARLDSAAKGEWSHPKVTEAADASHLELRILNPLPQSIFTHDEVTGKDGEEISVALVDANGNAKSFPEVKLNVVVLDGDFNSGNDRTWSKEDFDRHIVKKRDNKVLLAGHLQVTLKGGCAKLVGLKFADNSGFVRTKEFRLGVHVAPSDCEGLRIREAITDPFRVRDCRGKRNGKHDVPQFNDEIWRLRSIGKGGDYRRNLNANGVETVEDFLRLLVVNEQELRRLLPVGNGGMKNSQWKDLINHAKTCISSGKLYCVPTEIGVIVLNSFYELSELIDGGRHCSADSLTDDQKARARALVKEAYEKKMIMEYDDNHASLAQYNNRNCFQTEGLPGERLPACEGFVPTMVQPAMLQVQNFANNGTSQCSERSSFETVSTCDNFWANILANLGLDNLDSDNLDLDNLVQNSPPVAATVQPNINNDVRCKFRVVIYLLTSSHKFLERRESRFGVS